MVYKATVSALENRSVQEIEDEIRRRCLMRPSGDLSDLYRALERKRLQAFDQLLADIRSGVVNIVPVEATEEILLWLPEACNTVEQANRTWHDMLEAAPVYEPLKDWI